ncbi:hypothetical protein TNCV_4323441 [Trichonephila clavipes]|nr:hypothetical protein TNCV_4323441 [Trichonephila clavipes]
MTGRGPGRSRRKTVQLRGQSRVWTSDGGEILSLLPAGERSKNGRRIQRSNAAMVSISRRTTSGEGRSAWKRTDGDPVDGRSRIGDKRKKSAEKIIRHHPVTSVCGGNIAARISPGYRRVGSVGLNFLAVSGGVLDESRSFFRVHYWVFLEYSEVYNRVHRQLGMFSVQCYRAPSVRT